ncbi:MAG TPA: M50 family metallopeptidase [Pilimelia sp.]|nr:M50 family metallopeptidase [Pilimelia sp.]
MAVVEARVSVWEALAGRAPGQPTGPADPGLWAAVVERLNPARATPKLRDGIERVDLVSVRDVPYAMLRSPDDPAPGRGVGERACYLRLAPEEVRLTELMDGSRTVARLVAEFARICGRLAPDQVTRVVADLAANRMLEELPVDAFRPLAAVAPRPLPQRLGHGLLAAIRGRRMLLANVDPALSAIYRYGGRWLFTPVAAILLAVVAAAGLVIFGWTWWQGSESVFLTGGSYAAGAAVLLGLNVVALACHELGHGLAAKHASRRVPAAGFLVYFGIPSVFVDTTDVWMAGRRARLLTTLSGPAAGLVLAGAAQVVGLVVPGTAGWAFKLAFAWYVNALFNLNPFLALDGYYLLMDWLEVPNLRARGLAWVGSRLRRRPPAFRELDREGRLIALYGLLAVAWLLIAVNLAWRIWTDRVAGLAIGLWHTGWAARLLFVVVVAALVAPLIYLAAGRIAAGVTRLRRHLAERQVEADLPRRLAVLRGSTLGGLPAEALAQLAAQATWLHPRTGEQIVFAGTAQSSVLVVADGSLEGRRPGDPAGTVRQRVGPGGVIGLANALTGAPASLGWHTAGTTLLAVPSPTVAVAVGPLPGTPPVDRTEAEDLFAETPALEAMPAEDRLALATAATAVELGPGEPVYLKERNSAVVIGAGVIILPEGTALRRGTMIGPVDADLPDPVAYSRTHVRLWALPPVGRLPRLPGDSPVRTVGGVPVLGGPPLTGAHPPRDYPPLAAPPGPPPDVDDEVDRRFERILWWLVILLLVIGLLLTGSNLAPGPAWAEMPDDRALVTAGRGTVTATVDGRPVRLDRGDDIYVSAGDRVDVGEGGIARLTFRGGSASVLCADTQVEVGALRTEGSRPARPGADLTIHSGRLLADTATTSRAFQSLALTVENPAHTVVNSGPAWYAVNAAGGEAADGANGANGAEVSVGAVRVDDAVQQATRQPLTCGDGVPIPRPAGTPSEDPTPSPPPPTSPTAGPTPSPTPGASRTPGPQRTTEPEPTRPPVPAPGNPQPPAPAPPAPVPPPPPPGVPPPPPQPPNQAPVVSWTNQPNGTLAQLVNGEPCNGGSSTISAGVSVTDDGPTENLQVTLFWSGFDNDSRSMGPTGAWSASVGPINFGETANNGGTVSVWVTASDGLLSTTLIGPDLTVPPCPPPVE